MFRLGCSVYPEHTSVEQIKNYLFKMSKVGCKRIFSCLLSVESDRNTIINEFREWIDYAHELGMEVILDVSPAVFDRLQISYDDLSFFNELHADGIRLDEGFDGAKEANMTYNKYRLKIELNASSGTDAIKNIISYDPNMNKLITCHNFYPQKYTGISFDFFKKESLKMKECGLKVASFITTQNEGSYGPWPVNEGLCTLEMHRDLDMDLQLRHLLATKLVDDIIIANCFPSDKELELIKKIDLSKLTFKIDLEYQLSDDEKAIVFDFDHTVRGDLSEYVIRSTWPREKYKSSSIKPQNTRNLKRGDIVVVNDEYSRYKGELQICLKDMPNDGRKNVIGHLCVNEDILLDYLDSLKHFTFIENE